MKASLDITKIELRKSSGSVPKCGYELGISQLIPAVGLKAKDNSHLAPECGARYDVGWMV